MKNLILLLIALLLISCEKESTISTEYTAQDRPLYPQNPLPPQVTILNPVNVGGNGGITTPVAVGDTFNLRFSAEAGRTWWGGPTRLTKYRVVFNGRIWEEVNINGGKSYSGSTLITVDSPGVYGLGVTFFQADGNAGSQGFYVTIK